jgi:hypothetical protein
MSMPITAIIARCRAGIALADANGNGTITTAEISRAKKAGLLTAPEVKLLQRAASDIRQGQTLPNYFARLDLYEASAQAADSNGDGTLSRTEARRAADTYEGVTGTVWSNRAMLKKIAAF